MLKVIFLAPGVITMDGADNVLAVSDKKVQSNQ